VRSITERGINSVETSACGRLFDAVAWIAGVRDEGFELYLHAKVPPNEGGIALGQAMIANAAL
jgi:hydrogenase maturation factor HypF (carbamoyltransferase family)